MKKEYLIFNQRLAGYLMLSGFVLKRMNKSKDGSNRNVFLFNESEELLNKVKEFNK